MYVDGFSEINSKSLFHVIAGGPRSFVLKTFSLQGGKESAVQMDKVTEELIPETNKAIETIRKVLCFVTDSPLVMQATRKLLSRVNSGRSECVVFEYVCGCL